MKVICISGKAECGKDTTADAMECILRLGGKSVLVTHFADLLKYMCSTYFQWDGNKDEKGRELLQHIGTDIVREYDPEFWVRFVRDVLVIFDGYWDYVLIPDTRFPNEIECLRREEFDVHHIRVIRPGHSGSLSEAQQKHSSENALLNFPAEYTVLNDGDMTDLILKVMDIIADLEGKATQSKANG